MGLSLFFIYSTTFFHELMFDCPGTDIIKGNSLFQWCTTISGQDPLIDFLIPSGPNLSQLMSDESLITFILTTAGVMIAIVVTVLALILDDSLLNLLVP